MNVMKAEIDSGTLILPKSIILRDVKQLSCSIGRKVRNSGDT